jgi:hypothetical protein
MICRKLLELGLSPSEASRKVCERVFLGGVWGIWQSNGAGLGVALFEEWVWGSW